MDGNSQRLWNITSADNDTYTIQIPEGQDYYDANQYVGCPADNGRYITCTCTTGDHISWKLLADDDATRLFMARTELYDLLDKAGNAGYDITKFENIYNQKNSSLAEVQNAVNTLSQGYDLTLNYKTPDWNDFFISFETTTGSDNSSSNKWVNETLGNEKVLECYAYEGGATLTATVTVDQDATFCYSLSGNGPIKVMVDGKQVYDLTAQQVSFRDNRYFIELSSGKHTVQWMTEAGESSHRLYLSNIGVEKTPLITVSLLEPGSLGTEVLYHVNHLKDVRKLKIIGTMNDDDWSKINMMEANLFALDLSETTVKEIKKEQFYGANSWPFLHAVTLPEGLTKIGELAFSGSYVEDVNLPSTLQCIEQIAFGNTLIKEALLPESCLTLGDDIFENCKFLQKASLPEKLTVIPSDIFYGCNNVKIDHLPPHTTKIEAGAFFDCYYVSFDFPETLTSIESRAFWCTNTQGETKDKLKLPKLVNYVGYDAFNHCNSYTSAELPVSLYYISGSNMLPVSIKTLRLNSPTVVEHKNNIVDNDIRQGITLQVPSYLVNSYKLDEYWYNFGGIEGFNTSEINEWSIQRDLVLNARDRFEGTPSVSITLGGSLKVNGKDGMSLANLIVESNPDDKEYGRMFSNADGVTVNGELSTRLRLGTRNRWYYLSLPYDVKVSDIVKQNNNPKRAIRYYDGANRAANGVTGNWRNFANTDTIPAGTGFIFQVSEEGWWKLPAQDNDSKQYLTSNKMFVKALAENPSEKASDRGWNLVGNPYQCWYNIHKLNFSAPITVREGNSYAAYSVIDDDYALAPNQAFFVQSPEGIGSISFPLDGRQMTSVIEDMSGAKDNKMWWTPASSKRTLTDLAVSDGKNTDRTRIVLNDKASMAYEPACDASKFMSEDTVPQIYSLDDQGNQYAINERPDGNGIVKLGFRTSESGCFTISLKRNNADKVILVDNKQGTTVDLGTQDYQFTADAGTMDNRFELRMAHFDGTTDIQAVGSVSDGMISVADGGIYINHISGNVTVYTTGGVQVATTEAHGNQIFMALSKGSYIITADGKSTHVIVK